MANNKFAEVILQAVQIPIVLLTDVFLQLAGGSPTDIPRRGPGLGVSAGIVDQRFIMKCVLVGTAESLDNVKLVGVWMSEVVEPRALIEPDDIDDECVAFPTSD